MAAISVSLTAINQDGNGRIRLQFGNVEKEFSSLAALQSWVKDVLTLDVLMALYCRIAIDRQPTLNNPAALTGHTLTVDTSLNNWGTVA